MLALMQFSYFHLFIIALSVVISLSDNYATDGIKYFEMNDGTLVNAALYQMKNIKSYKQDNTQLLPPIVLIHGFMNSRRYWDSLLHEMLNSELFVDHPIITISLRGMGDSQYINTNTVNNYQTNIDDILSVLSQIGINENIKCIFIGQSFGSMITNQLVINQLHRVYGVVLMGTLAFVDDTINQIIDSFKWHDGNNWTYSLKMQTDTNWDVSYNDGRIDESYHKLMKSEQSKLKYEIMTNTQFRPYDLRKDIGYFNNIPIILVRGNKDFIPRQTIEPLVNIGNNVKVLDYKCATCDHDIVFDHEQQICEQLYRLIKDTRYTKTEL